MIDLCDQYGALRAYYQEKKLPKIFYENSKFSLKYVWVNEQPVKHIKDFEFKELKKDDFIYYEARNGKLFITLRNEEKISLTIKINKFSYKNYNLNKNLKVSGLKKLLCDEFNWRNLEIFDSKGDSLDTLEATSPILGSCLKEDTILCLKKIETVSDKIKKENEGRSSSSEISMHNLKFVNFKNEIGLIGEGPGLNLIGKCQNKTCNLKNITQCTNKGFSEDKSFDIGDLFLDIKCSGCGSNYINSCSLLDCGYKIVNGETKNGISELEGKDKQVKMLGIPLTFDNSAENMEEWITLKMQVKRLQPEMEANLLVSPHSVEYIKRKQDELEILHKKKESEAFRRQTDLEYLYKKKEFDFFEKKKELEDLHKQKESQALKIKEELEANLKKKEEEATSIEKTLEGLREQKKTEDSENRKKIQNLTIERDLALGVSALIATLAIVCLFFKK